MKNALILFAFISVTFISGCSPEPEQINYGSDVCDYCKMNITDNRFAAEIVTKKNKLFKFDSIECLLGYEFESLINKNEIHSEWVNDFSNPGELIDFKKAFYLQNDDLRSPMGLNVLSVSSTEKLEEIKNKYGGSILSFSELKKLAEKDL